MHKPVIEGFTLRGFRDGIVVRCADGLRLTRTRVLHSRRYGASVWRSVSGRIDRSVLLGAQRAGVRVTESRALRVDHNRAQRATGGFQIDNSSSIRVDHNLATHNTAGILSFALPGLAVKANTAVRLDHNRVSDNNRRNPCAGSHEALCSVLPGSGILVLAGDHGRVEANRVLRNRAFGIAVTSYCGGLGLPIASCRGLDLDPYPDGNRIAANVVRGNGPPAGSAKASPLTVDLGWDQTGLGNCWRQNDARRSFPGTLPACVPGIDDCWRGTDCLPGGARPAVEVGIGEQSMSFFDDPLFAELGLRRARIIVPWNLAARPEELSYVADWLAAARRGGVEPFVHFTRETSSRCPNQPCYLPSVAEYSAAFQDFRARFPFVTVFGIWNEANHPSQPTFRNPPAAAAYYQAARSLCPDCQIVAADLLDSANMNSWVAEFRPHAGKIDIWGLHNYSDANQLPDMPSDGTARFLSATSGQVWLTETGGIVRRIASTALGTLPYDEDRAAWGVGRSFDLAALYRSRVSRMYLYSWRGAFSGVRWDSGLERGDGSPRPGYFTAKAQMETDDFGP